MPLNMNKLTEKAQEALVAAQSQAQEMNHSAIETEHLLARLPLHVRARPGQEADALRQAMEHARSAESA